MEEDIKLDKHENSKLWPNSKEDGGSCLWNERFSIPQLNFSVRAKPGFLDGSNIALF